MHRVKSKMKIRWVKGVQIHKSAPQHRDGSVAMERLSGPCGNINICQRSVYTTKRRERHKFILIKIRHMPHTETCTSMQ